MLSECDGAYTADNLIKYQNFKRELESAIQEIDNICQPEDTKSILFSENNEIIQSTLDPVEENEILFKISGIEEGLENLKVHKNSNFEDALELFSIEVSSKIGRILLWSQNKHLHYVVIRLFFMVVVSNVELPNVKPACKNPLRVFYDIANTLLYYSIPKDSTSFPKLSSLTLQSCFNFYHLLLKYFRGNMQASSKKNVVANELDLNNIILLLQKHHLEVMSRFPELESDIVRFLLDLLKDSSLMSSPNNSVMELCFKMLHISRSENQFNIRKRLELATMLLKINPTFSSWEHVLVFLVDHIQLVSGKINNVDWTEFIENSQSAFISQSFEFPNKEFYDFESLRSCTLLAVSAVHQYFQYLSDSSWAEAKVLDASLRNLLDVTEDRLAFCMTAQIHAVFFLFLTSQPCLLKLISIVIDIESIQRTLALDIIKSHSELVTRLAELTNAHLLAIRFFKSQFFSEDILISLITQGDLDGIDCFRKLLVDLNTPIGWRRFLNACRIFPTSIFYDVGLMMFDILRAIQSKDILGNHTLANLNSHTKMFFDTMYADFHSILRDVCMRFSVINASTAPLSKP